MANVPASLSLARIATRLARRAAQHLLEPSGQVCEMVPPGIGTMQPPKP